jgi:thiol-disulfide isomerase/thioredoxin
MEWIINVFINIIDLGTLGLRSAFMAAWLADLVNARASKLAGCEPDTRNVEWLLKWLLLGNVVFLVAWIVYPGWVLCRFAESMELTLDDATNQRLQRDKTAAPTGHWTGNAQDFWVTSFNGSRFRIEEKYAGRPLVLNFWAIWCAPCVAEFREFQRAYGQHMGRFAMLSVAVDSNPDPAKFVKLNGYGWDFALDTDGSKRYAVTAIPRTLFISPTGDIVADQQGAMTQEVLEGYLAKLIKS